MQERASKVEATIARRRSMNLGTRSESRHYNTIYSPDDIPRPQLDQVLVENQRNRYEAVRSVESSVHEVSKMFAELSELIVRDDYTIMRIDESVDDALENMERGHSELIKYYEKVKGNKCLMIKIFGVIIVFLLVFILII
jgi:t-SNARE complex subunit (syntaxin)